MKALVLVLVLLASPALAQKPVGVFDPGTTPPAWASFGTISDTVSDARLRDAAELSRARGFLWVLGLGYWNDPREPIGPHAARVRARLETAGLWPYVVAFSVSEEWYEQWLAGALAVYGLPADNPQGVHIIHDWLGKQHAAAKAALGRPVVWITTVAGDLPWAYRPIPAHTDFVAVDAYIPAGGTFAQHVAPIFALAERAVAGTSIRLVQVPPWFAADGWETPSALDVAKYAAWVARPLWFATLGFTWQDRPALSMRGLQSLTSVRASVERTLKVRE